MFLRRILPAALLVLCAAFAVPARAADDKKLPAVVVRVAPYDSLMGDFRFLADSAGKGEEFKQLEGTFKEAFKGIEKGIDTKKPMGLYANIKNKVEESEVVVLAPVADQKAFVELLNKQDNVKVKEGKQGLYTVETGGAAPEQVYLRFAKGYAYFTYKEPKNIDPDRLLDPTAVFPPEKVGVASVTVNIDQIPKELRDMGVAAVVQQLAALKEDAMPGETETQKAMRLASIDETGRMVKMILEDGKQVALRFDIDQKTTDIKLSLAMTGQPGSPLAKQIDDLGQSKSVGAGVLATDSAMNFLVHYMMPEKFKKPFAAAIEEEFKKNIDKEEDKDKKAMAERLFKVLQPTLNQGELDAAFDVVGPRANGKFAGVLAVRVEKGGDIDKALRDAIKSAPEKERAQVKLDFDKAGPVAIHRVEINDEMTKEQRDMFGDSKEVFFAVREDAALVGFGEKGLDALKAAIASKPKTGSLIQFEMAMGRLAKLMSANEQTPGAKAMPKAAQQAFGKAGKDADKITFKLEGGKALSLHIGMKGPMLKFFALVAEADKKID